MLIVVNQIRVIKKRSSKKKKIIYKFEKVQNIFYFIFLTMKNEIEFNVGHVSFGKCKCINFLIKKKSTKKI
jgi:hypothetical protein